MSIDSSNNSELQVEIISPKGVIFNDYCHLAVIPGNIGDIGVMNNHELVLTSLRKGQVEIYDKSEKLINSFEINSGFAHNEQEKLLVLVD